MKRIATVGLFVVMAATIGLLCDMVAELREQVERQRVHIERACQ